MIRGLLFDLNGTLIDISTDETREELYRVMSRFLLYFGVRLGAEDLRRLFFDLNRRQRQLSEEPYPEFDAVSLFRTVLKTHAPDGKAVPTPSSASAALPEMLSRLFRAASLCRLQLYPEVRETLGRLRERYALAVVSDGQSVWERAEMKALGLDEYFETVIISGDVGFRKPDPRMFELALSAMRLRPDEALYIGNDMYRDVFGARRCGMGTVFFQSNQGGGRFRDVEPDRVISRFGDLPQAVESLSRRG